MTPVSGRQFILDNLEDERLKKDQTVQDFFLLNNYVPKSVCSIDAIALKKFDPASRRQDKHEAGVEVALEVRSALHQLSRDLSQINSRYKPEDWQFEILADARRLLHHQRYFWFDLCERLQHCLSKWSATTCIFPPRMVTDGIDSFARLDQELGEAKEITSMGLEEFLAIFGHDKLATGRVTVPASTLRELLVLNAISEVGNQIFDAVGSSNTLDSQAKATSIIEAAVSRELAILDQDPDCTWRSQAIVIVAIVEHRMLICGATRPNALSKELEHVGKAITAERLGTRFSKIVNSCSKDFWNNVEHKADSNGQPFTDKTVRTLADDEVQTLYNEVVTEATLKSVPAWDGLISPVKHPILCWAFDGNSLLIKPPCLRCQMLYRTWGLAQKPAGISEQRSSLEGVRGRKIMYVPNNKFPCTWCAETVAAAKVYLLYHGIAVLV